MRAALRVVHGAGFPSSPDIVANTSAIWEADVMRAVSQIRRQQAHLYQQREAEREAEAERKSHDRTSRQTSRRNRSG